MNSMKLLCFPYAGGSSAVFSAWPRHLAAGIEIRALELPGRGKRFGEANLVNFKDVVQDMMAQCIGEIQNSDYALFGHSLGGKVAYGLAGEILKRGLPAPKHIFVSGRGAPFTAGKHEKKYSKLSDEQFKEEIISLGGTPPEFFDSPELIEIFFPILRNDFRLAEEYEANEVQADPLPCDLSVFVGRNEELTSEQIVRWKDYTKGECSIFFFHGGHFFIHERVNEVIDRINKSISAYG